MPDVLERIHKIRKRRETLARQEAARCRLAALEAKQSVEKAHRTLDDYAEEGARRISHAWEGVLGGMSSIESVNRVRHREQSIKREQAKLAAMLDEACAREGEAREAEHTARTVLGSASRATAKLDTLLQGEKKERAIMMQRAEDNDLDEFGATRRGVR